MTTVHTPNRLKDAAAGVRLRLAAGEDESRAWCANAMNHFVRATTEIESMIEGPVSHLSSLRCHMSGADAPKRSELGTEVACVKEASTGAQSESTEDVISLLAL